MEEKEFSEEELENVIGGISYEVAIEKALEISEISSEEKIEQLKQFKAEIEEKQQQRRNR